MDSSNSVSMSGDYDKSMSYIPPVTVLPIVDDIELFKFFEDQLALASQEFKNRQKEKEYKELLDKHMKENLMIPVEESIISVNSIITKSYESKLTAIVLAVLADGRLYVRLNENRLTPGMEGIWEGSYIKLADVRGIPKSK